jgi:hypothetical protein
MTQRLKNIVASRGIFVDGHSLKMSSVGLNAFAVEAYFLNVFPVGSCFEEKLQNMSPEWLCGGGTVSDSVSKSAILRRCL